MCRKNELLGTALLSCGVGVLLSLLFTSEFALALVGIVLLLVGFCITRRI